MIGTGDIMFAVRAAFTLVNAAQQRAIDRASFTDITYLTAPLPEEHPSQRARRLLSNTDHWIEGHPRTAILQDFEDTITTTERGWRIINPDAPEERQVALLAALETAFPDERDLASDADVETARYVLHSWTSKDQSRRDRVGLLVDLSGIALEYLSSRSGNLGLKPRAQNIVAAVSDGLAAHFTTHREEIVATAFTAGSMKRVGEILLSTSLQMAEDRPDLFSESEPVKALIRSAASPLRVLNETNRTAQLSAGARLMTIRETLRGPVGLGILQTLYDHRQTLFDGSYPDQGTAAAVVTDALFSSVVEVPDEGNIFSIFTPGFFGRVYPNVIAAIGEQPEAFIRGKGQHVELGQEFLTGLASALSPDGIQLRPDIARSVFEMGVSLSRKHANIFLVQEAQDFVDEWATRESVGKTDPWALLQIRLTAKIASQVITTFEGSGGLAQALMAPANKGFMLDLVGDIAAQVSETPGMLVGNDVNPEVLRITQGVASFVASEHADLLTRSDWQRVTAKAVELALQNPGQLFGLKDQSPKQLFTLNLVSEILRTAHGSLISENNSDGARTRLPGRVLFGKTLASALILTFERTAAHVDETDLDGTKKAVIRFVKQLNDLAAAGNGIRRLSSQDWLQVFSWYLGDIIENRSVTLSPEQIFAALDNGGPVLQVAAASVAAVPAAASPPAAPPPPASEHPPPVPTETGEEIYYEPVDIEGALG